MKASLLNLLFFLLPIPTHLDENSDNDDDDNDNNNGDEDNFEEDLKEAHGINSRDSERGLEMQIFVVLNESYWSQGQNQTLISLRRTHHIPLRQVELDVLVWLDEEPSLAVMPVSWLGEHGADPSRLGVMPVSP